MKKSVYRLLVFVLFQAEDGIRYLVRSRGLGDVYKRQGGRASAARVPQRGRGGDLRDVSTLRDAPAADQRTGDNARFQRLCGRANLDSVVAAALRLSLIHISEPTRPY